MQLASLKMEKNMEILLKEEVGGRTLSIQTDKVAKQASGSVVVQYGDTTVLVTAVADHEVRISDFLPLTVEYQEKNLCSRSDPRQLLPS